MDSNKFSFYVEAPQGPSEVLTLAAEDYEKACRLLAHRLKTDGSYDFWVGEVSEYGIFDALLRDGSYWGEEGFHVQPV